MAGRLVAFAATGVCLAAAEPQTPSVPATTRLTAMRGAAPLARALSGLGVPVGLVTSEDPFVPAEARFAPSRDSMKVEDVLAILVDRHPRYSARWTDGVVRLREDGLACGAAVDDITVGPLTLDGDMLRLFMLLAWVAGGQSSPAPAGNINITVGESAAAAVPAPPRVLHVVVPADASLANALDLVVTTAGGGAWIVWEHPVGNSQVGCRMIGYSSDGSTSAASSSDFKIVE